MGTLERTDKEKKIIKAITWTAIFAVLIYVFLLINTASGLSGSVSQAVTHQGRLGPITLFSLSKSPMNDSGTSAEISFNKGSLIYFGCWVTITTLVIWGYSRKSSKSK